MLRSPFVFFELRSASDCRLERHCFFARKKVSTGTRHVIEIENAPIGLALPCRRAPGDRALLNLDQAKSTGSQQTSRASFSLRAYLPSTTAIRPA